MKELPCSESKTFTVCLDPQSATLPLGEVEVLLPINVPPASSPPCAHTTFWGSWQVWDSSRYALGSHLAGLSFSR